MRNLDLSGDSTFWAAMANFLLAEGGLWDQYRILEWEEYLDELNVILRQYGGRVDVIGDIHGENDWVVSFKSKDDEAIFLLKFV